MAKEKIIEVKNLKTYFFIEEGVSKAVDGVSFEIYPGETLGIVGESGCGKTVTSLSILKLIPEPAGKIIAGEIIYKGKDLLKMKNNEIEKVRGSEIAMIFQEPMTSLNPVYTIGNQIIETIMLHEKKSYKEARNHAISMLDKVNIPLPKQRIDEYPHQLSGGMRQRAIIAMALSCDPSLLIADEPTTALDVTIQAQVIELITNLQKKTGMSILMVTHNMGIIAEIADRVAVMYAGKIIEYAEVKNLFSNPLHPYSIGLLLSIPRLDQDKHRLHTICGNVPNLWELPKGCKFCNRCSFATDICLNKEPDLVEVKKDHKVRCWNFEKL